MDAQELHIWETDITRDELFTLKKLFGSKAWKIVDRIIESKAKAESDSVMSDAMRDVGAIRASVGAHMAYRAIQLGIPYETTELFEAVAADEANAPK